MELYSKENEVLFALLSFELFGKEIAVDEAGVDWRKVIFTANEHAVTPLLHAGFRRFPDADRECAEFVERVTVRAIMKSERMASVQNEIFEALSARGVRAAVLKGTSLQALYRHPEARVTGDIDILIDSEKMAQAEEIFAEMGFSKEKSSGLHHNFRKGRVLVEAHREVSIFPENGKGKFAREFMRGALSAVKKHCMGAFEFFELDTPYQTVALLSHMERHMGAGGIGLRQLCDWAMFVKSIPSGKRDEIKGVLEKCGLFRFAGILTGCCEAYLGLEDGGWISSGDRELIDEVMGEILCAGNFQAQFVKRPFASAMIDAYDADGSGKRSAFKAYFKRVERKMRNEYTWAKSRIWIPFFGVYFFFRAGIVILKRKTAGNVVFNTMKDAKTREKLLRKMNLYK